VEGRAANVGFPPFSMLVWNTNFVKEPLADYDDLLKPEFKGHLGARDGRDAVLAGYLDFLETKLGHPLRLAHPLGNGLPATYIACTEPPWGSTASSRALARAMPDWSYLELATAHDAMLLVPDELTAILASL